MHSKLCGDPVSKKELQNSNFKSMKKIHKSAPMEINGNQRISMIFTVSELFIRIYEMYECWKAHSNFELDIDLYLFKKTNIDENFLFFASDPGDGNRMAKGTYGIPNCVEQELEALGNTSA